MKGLRRKHNQLLQAKVINPKVMQDSLYPVRQTLWLHYIINKYSRNVQKDLVISCINTTVERSVARLEPKSCALFYRIKLK